MEIRSTVAFSDLKALCLGVLLFGLLSGCTSLLMDSGGFPEFPWPPPKPSAKTVIPDEFLRTSTNVSVGDVATRLTDSLTNAGYADWSFFHVPDGFALATQLEQTEADGTPMTGAERWAIRVPAMRRFTLSEYLRALFTSRPGHFRVVVFIVTPHPFSTSGSGITGAGAHEWLHEGLNKLPPAIASESFSTNHTCTSLIYEFRKIAVDEEAQPLDPSEITALQHLTNARLWAYLQKP